MRLQHLGRIQATDQRRPGVGRCVVRQQPGLVRHGNGCRTRSDRRRRDLREPRERQLPQRRVHLPATDPGRVVNALVRQRHRPEPRRAPHLRRQHRGLTGGEERVRLGRTPYGLGGVVDQDVERPALAAQLLADAEDLTRIAQIHRDDGQPVPPRRAAGDGAEPAQRVGREPRGDEQFGTVAQHHQRELETDLHASAGQQRPPAAQIGSLAAPGGVVGGALRAEPVVEGVGLAVGPLADVAAPRPGEQARHAGSRQRRVLAAVHGAGRGAGGHRLVGGGHHGAAGLAAPGAPVPDERSRDPLGPQPHRVVGRQLPQPPQHPVQRREFVLRHCPAACHPAPPRA